ncbi:hypothetical protein SO802_034339 [Lithocarpus litseifolius]|uniref:Bifunctional inhibitor/plant lipid transfer protein/seed storage helical domain-containing protein n=1 Tax=Lithocarpus litseifolius TaxID=425828 RepID=A0AAW2BJ17_9ROSI
MQLEDSMSSLFAILMKDHCYSDIISVTEKKEMGNMMKGSRVFMLLLVIIMVVLSMEGGVKLAKAAGPSAAQCKEERRLGINACKPVVYGKLPTPECCERVRVTHIECVCTVVTPKLAALIDINRAIRLIEGCGRRVPRHFKCGKIRICLAGRNLWDCVFESADFRVSGEGISCRDFDIARFANRDSAKRKQDC